MIEAAATASSIEGSVFLDQNGDGIRNGGEVGVGAALLRVTSPAGTPSDVPVALDGSFRIDGVQQGRYTIAVLAPGLSGSLITVREGIVDVPASGTSRIVVGVLGVSIEQPQSNLALAYTGYNPLMVAAIGVLLVECGLLLVRVRRRGLRLTK